MKNIDVNKGVKRENIVIELWESIIYICRGVLYYYYLLIDFLFGNISNIVMYNLLKVTIVFLTVVSFSETFSGLKNNFFSPWTALLVTLGVQGTLMALSLYVPVLYTGYNKVKQKKVKIGIQERLKRYLIWIPLICCLTVSSFFSYVSISEKMYSKIEHINNEFKLKEILNNTFTDIDKSIHEHVSTAEENIANLTDTLGKEIVNFKSINTPTENTSNDIQEEIKDLEKYVNSNLDKYNRSIINYERYQEEVTTTVNRVKREVNQEKADLELAFIEEYENNKYKLDNLKDQLNLDLNVTAQALSESSKDILATQVEESLDTINSYNIYDIKLSVDNVEEFVADMGTKLDTLGLLNIKLSYLTELVNYKMDLQEYKANFDVERNTLIEDSDLNKVKELIFQAPFNKYITSPINIDNVDIEPVNTFVLLEEVYNHERLTDSGTNQIEKAVGYLVNNSFPLLAYISIFMAFFIDGLILIQGFSVTKKVSKAEEMEDVDKEDFIFWMLRRSVYDFDPLTNKVKRMKVIDKFFTYCVPNENCSKIYLNIDAARANPEMSMMISLLNKLNYLILNEDDRLTLDTNLMVIYFQRTSAMVDVDYFYKKD